MLVIWLGVMHAEISLIMAPEPAEQPKRLKFTHPITYKIEDLMLNQYMDLFNSSKLLEQWQLQRWKLQRHSRAYYNIYNYINRTKTPQ